MRIVCILFSNPRFISEVAEACYRWTPQIAVRPGEALFLEIERCHRLYSEKTLILRLQGLLKRFKVNARIAVADDVFMSLAWARYGRSAAVQVRNKKENEHLPLEALLDVSSPFQKDEELQKNILTMIEELKRLGLKNLGDFLKLPQKSLASRFQRQSLELHSRLQNGPTGTHVPPSERRDSPEGNFNASLSLWPRFVPLEKIRETTQIDYNDNCLSLEPLLFIIKGLLGRAMARLAGRGERLSRAVLHFDLEKYSTTPNPKRSWYFELPLSQGAVTGLLPLIHERLNFELTREPLVSPVIGMTFEILETVPGQYFQRHFFNKKEEEQEAWNSLITRLCEKLGRTYIKEGGHAQPAQAFVAEAVQNYKPERAWHRVVVEKAALGQLVGVDLPLPERPLRLLQRPKRLKKCGNFLTSDESLDWEIIDWEGPERLSGEWWGEEFRRDYFRVETKNGEQLWVFRVPDPSGESRRSDGGTWVPTGTDNEVFLHGYFD